MQDVPHPRGVTGTQAAPGGLPNPSAPHQRFTERILQGHSSTKRPQHRSTACCQHTRCPQEQTWSPGKPQHQAAQSTQAHCLAGSVTRTAGGSAATSCLWSTAGHSRDHGMLRPYLCWFCWGRFSGSIYILLGLESLRRGETNIWIQSHLQKKGEKNKNWAGQERAADGSQGRRTRPPGLPPSLPSTRPHSPRNALTVAMESRCPFLTGGGGGGGPAGVRVGGGGGFPRLGGSVEPCSL